MKGKKLLAAFLLGVGLCFVPALGYGLTEYEEHELEKYVTDLSIKVYLLEAKVYYIMLNPTDFLSVQLFHDPDGSYEEWFPEAVDTKNKVIVFIRDTRGVFSHKSGTVLLEQFKVVLESICSFIILTDFTCANVVAKFLTKRSIPLGYFYQGEYHLWEK